MPAILFVEDDTTIAMGVGYSLKQDGFQVSLANLLEEAREVLLTALEYRLLLTLVANQGRVLRRAQIPA